MEGAADGRGPRRRDRRADPTTARPGWLVDSPAECADACREILDDPAAAASRGRRGKEDVRQRFLMPRLLRDWLALFNRLDGNDLGETGAHHGRDSGLYALER